MTRNIAAEIGIDPYERVLVAVLPEMWTDEDWEDHGIPSSRGVNMKLVTAKLGEYRRRVIDLLSEDGRPARWWQVDAAARIAGRDVVPVRYDGPASDIPQHFLDGSRGSEVVLLRLAARGPWARIKQSTPVPPEAAGGMP